jgi:hypothetical protein
MNLSFSLDGDQGERSSFLGNGICEVDDLFPILEEEMGVNKRKTYLNINLYYLFDSC